jgi:hypothetical protein
MYVLAWKTGIFQFGAFYESRWACCTERSYSSWYLLKFWFRVGVMFLSDLSYLLCVLNLFTTVLLGRLVLFVEGFLPCIIFHTNPTKCCLVYLLQFHVIVSQILLAILLLPVPVFLLLSLLLPLRGPHKWVREMAIPRCLRNPVSSGIAGQPCLRGYTYGSLVLQVGGWACGRQPHPVKRNLSRIF